MYIVFAGIGLWISNFLVICGCMDICIFVGVCCIVYRDCNCVVGTYIYVAVYCNFVGECL